MCTDYKDLVILLCKVLIFFIKIMPRIVTQVLVLCLSVCLLTELLVIVSSTVNTPVIFIAFFLIFHRVCCHLFCIGVIDLMASIYS